MNRTVTPVEVAKNDSRNRDWGQGRGDRGSYQGNRSDHGNSTPRHRVRFDDPDRSPELADSHGDKFYRDYIEYKSWKDGNSSS